MKNKILLIGLLIVLLFPSLLLAQTLIRPDQIKGGVYTKAETNATIEAAIAAIPTPSSNQTISVPCSEDLAVGDVVSLINSYGTVTAKKNNLAVNTSPNPNGAESVFASEASDYITNVEIDSTRFVAIYRKSTQRFYAKVGTVTGSAISWGSESSTFENKSCYFVSATLVSTNKILVVYGNADDSKCQAVCLSIVSTTINLGTPVPFETSTFLRYPSVVKIDTDKAIIGYQRSSDTIGRVVVCTVTGTVPSFGDIATFNNAVTYYVSCSAFSPTSVLISYQDTGNSSHGMAQVLSISGTTITPGTEYVFKAATTSFISSAPMSATTAVITYESEGGATLVATNNSGALSFGTAATFTDGQYNSTTKISDNSVLISSQVAATDNGQSIIGTVSGTNMVLGTAYTYNAATTTYNKVTYLGVGKSIITYSDDGNSNYGTAVVNTAFNTSYDSIAGISQSSYSSGQTASILIKGTAPGSFSVFPTSYWVQSDYSLGTLPVSLNGSYIRMGISKSATEIVLD